MKIKIRQKGFTLIELLIVIALLGALAVGLLAAVDPFEQLKKGNDTSYRNTVAEFHNAAIRFYGTEGNFPGGLTSGTKTLNNVTADAIPTLSAAGELKTGYTQLAGGTTVLAKMYVTVQTAAGSENVVVCFTPQSKSFQRDENTQYTTAGVTTTGCKSQTGNASCAWCIQ